MSSPDESISVALEALRFDARKWQAAAEDLHAPMGATRPLTVSADEVSMFAADRGIHECFNDSRAEIENMIRQAADYFAQISSDLNSSANQYQMDDEAGQQEIQGAYQMKGDIFDG